MLGELELQSADFLQAVGVYFRAPIVLALSVSIIFFFHRNVLLQVKKRFIQVEDVRERKNTKSSLFMD